MSRANPFDFVRALKSRGVSLVADNGDRVRPKKLFRGVERSGIALEYSGPSAKALAGFGFTPETVFDVGVDQGTPLIYNTYPNAKFVLIDPVAESEQRVEGWKDRINYAFHCCALGANRGEVEINIPSTTTKKRISRASAFEFEPGNAAQFASFEKRTVPMTTLDSLSWRETGPFGVKIDTEGYELEVIKGAKKTLANAEFVIAEVSVKRRFQGSYRFSELIGALGKQGFEPLDFLSPLRPDREGCDILFARYDSARFDFSG
jgi:FkbM family methyltransferase